jgi:hypothetical protein
MEEQCVIDIDKNFINKYNKKIEECEKCEYIKGLKCEKCEMKLDNYKDINSKIEYLKIIIKKINNKDNLILTDLNRLNEIIKLLSREEKDNIL